MQKVTENDRAVTDGYQWKKLGSLTPHQMPGVAISEAAQPVSEHQLGYDEGHAEGYREGLAQASAEQQNQLLRCQQVLDEVTRLRTQIADEGLQDMAVALHMLFQQVFQYELRTAPALIAAIAAELQKMLRAEITPNISLNRQDCEALLEIAPPELQPHLMSEDGLPVGVIRASAGKSMLELNLVANLEQVLANATASLQEPALRGEEDTKPGGGDDGSESAA